MNTQETLNQIAAQLKSFKAPMAEVKPMSKATAKVIQKRKTDLLKSLGWVSL